MKWFYYQTLDFFFVTGVARLDIRRSRSRSLFRFFDCVGCSRTSGSAVVSRNGVPGVAELFDGEDGVVVAEVNDRDGSMFEVCCCYVCVLSVCLSFVVASLVSILCVCP